MTGWSALIDTNAPLPEYPRPQMVRSNWMNLNGIWQFQPGATNDPVPAGQTLSSQILVPYPMESAISGVMQYHEFSWYRRTFTVPVAWSGQRIILHLDAVTWETTVYVNGQQVGIHKGGYDPFSFDLTSYLNGGTNELILRVFSPEGNSGQPRGKQTINPGGIMYTSSSGIWQPAWLEPVDPSGISSLRLIPDVDNSQLRLTVNTYAASGVSVVATVLTNGVAFNSITGSPDTELDIAVANPNLWSPENPFLYGLQVLTIHNGVTNDRVSSYFGMRKIAVVNSNGIPLIYLNNHQYFQIGPLDQGYWPDGIYTAPTDAALEFDLLEEKTLGFNAVRKHEKVERQRWYYWADTLGLFVWQDMPTCNSYTGNANPPAVDPVQFISELSDLVTNHWNSPSIIMWDVFNEDQGEAGSSDGVGQTNTAYLCQLVADLDPSRLVNQASGGAYFGVGDIFDNHSYPAPGDPASTTQAAVDGEFGGIGFLVPGHLWNPSAASTAYIAAPTAADIAPLYDPFMDDLVGYKAGGLNAGIYTQITDVENECDGLLTYDRILKTDGYKLLISNQKAITGQLTVTPVVPTSQIIPQSWRYTTSTPATNWFAPNFNASSWSTGVGGFGTADPGVTPNTSWTTQGYIYLRRTFNPGALTAQQISNLAFSVYHDENVAIYINGVLAATDSDYTTAYINLPMSASAQAAIIPNGTNVLAVSCYQTTGGQFIDVGISDQVMVDNTFTVPADEIGYWPLDATSGTVAVDATGSGNNGIVNGATWNPNGEINGCLSFNGINNDVQITNPINTDFSIAFWVKTTQTAGTGEWFNGTGLVDGDYPGKANDFGTALVGSKFGFGVGNPDTTIVSTTSINDGNWHQCVATRVQATGAISIYVDGNLQAVGTGNQNPLNASTLLLFGALASGGGYFNGSLDEVKIYNRALGNNEISALYNNGVFPSTMPVVAEAPAPQTVFVGQSATFLVQAFGGNLSYQWSKGSTPIAGATNNTLILSDVALADANTYSVLVSNPVGTASSSAALTVLPPTLQHRYSFTSDASDSVGGANGTLMGSATISGGQLHLPGGPGSVAGGNYVQLPHGMFLGDNSVTVETWLTDNAGVTWAEPWCIGGSTTAITGDTGNNYISLIPHSNTPDMRAAFKESGTEDDVIWSNNTLPLNTEEYVVLTYNASSRTAMLYLNGVLVAVNNIPYTPSSLGDTYDNFLGLDEFNDNLFQGSIDEFRIWNGSVTPLYLTVSTAAGPNVVATNLTPLSITVTATNASMTPGLTEQAIATANFSGAAGVAVTSFVTNWTSSHPDVLTVNGSGVMTAVNTGSATITATLNGVSGSSASITVATSPPVITQQPTASENLLAGATLNATVANVGNPPFVYRWYFNNGASPVSTSTSPGLTVPDLQSANAGTYTCFVSNQYGAVLSSSLTLTVVLPTTYQQSLLSLGSIAYWPLSETSGTVAHDLVGNYNGTYEGGFTLAQSGPATPIFGSVSRSTLFNGTSGYVDIPEGPFNLTNAMTTVAWVNLVSLPNFSGLLGHGDASWRMSIASSGQPGANDGSSAAGDATDPGNINDGNWHMIAYVYTGVPGNNNNGSLYVDGVLAANNTVTITPGGDNLDVWIGGSPDYGTSRLLNAKIAHAAIFNQALTASQIQDLYTGTYAVPVNLTVTHSGSNVVLDWPAGLLLQASAFSGPWTTNSSAVSPYTVPIISGNQFFRVQVNP